MSDDLVVGGDPDRLQDYSEEVLGHFDDVSTALEEYRSAVEAYLAAPSDLDAGVPDRSLDVEAALSDLEDADRVPGGFGELLREFDDQWANAALAELIEGDPELAAVLAGGADADELGDLDGEEAAALLFAFYDGVDVAHQGGDPDDADDRVSRDDLIAIAADETQPEALRRAASWLLDHEEAIDDLDTAHEGGGTDGLISSDDVVDYLAEQRELRSIGEGDLYVPEGSETVTFDIPQWEGHGTTRIQYFIDDDEVCLSGTGPDVACGEGDNRDFAEDEAAQDYNVGSRVRVVLDHEQGRAVVVSYPTHDSESGDMAALPVEMTTDPGGNRLPDEYPSQFRVYTHGDGIDGNVVFDYRFLNSMTPETGAGLAPAINGAVRVRPGEDGTVLVDGRVAQYPSIEIMRDHPTEGGGYETEIILQRRQESGGPLNLTEPGTPIEASG